MTKDKKKQKLQLPTLEYDEPEISNYSKLLKHISWRKLQFNKSKH